MLHHLIDKLSKNEKEAVELLGISLVTLWRGHTSATVPWISRPAVLEK